MKLLYYIALLVIFNICLSGIEVQNGSGCIVPLETQDRTLFYYHNHSDDFHYSGPEKWAVEFAFPDTLQIDSLYYYIPNELNNDPATVKIYWKNTHTGQNAEILDSLSFSVTDADLGWNSFDVPDSVVTDSLLMVLVYPTLIDYRFVSASEGSGEHSFYYSNGIRRNFANQGFSAELLFSVRAYFTDVPEVELSYFGYTYSGTRNIFPKFTVKNNSSTMALTADDSLKIHFILERADTTNIEYDYPILADNNTIAPQQELFVDLYLNNSYSFALLSEIRQFRFSAAISCLEETYVLNNYGSVFFHNFSDQYLVDKVLVEPFLLWQNGNNEDTQSILAAEEQLEANPDVQIVNYFPNYSDDPFYTYSAELRSGFYETSAYPSTYIAGLENIYGYSPAFIDSVNAAVSRNNERRTYISSDISNFVIANNEILRINLSLRNAECHIFNSYGNNLRIFGAILQNNIQDLSGSIMLKLYNLTGEASVFSFQTAEERSLDILLEDIHPIVFNEENPAEILLRDCQFVYWVQNSETREIDFWGNSGYLGDLEVSVDEETNPESNHLLVYPNPFSEKSGLNIGFKKPFKGYYKITIYNLKGQLINKFPMSDGNSKTLFMWNGKNSDNKPVSPGIYLLRVEAEGSEKSIITRKILKIK